MKTLQKTSHLLLTLNLIAFLSLSCGNNTQTTEPHSDILSECPPLNGTYEIKSALSPKNADLLPNDLQLPIRKTFSFQGQKLNIKITEKFNSKTENFEPYVDPNPIEYFIDGQFHEWNGKKYFSYCRNKALLITLTDPQNNFLKIEYEYKLKDPLKKDFIFSMCTKCKHETEFPLEFGIFID